MSAPKRGEDDHVPIAGVLDRNIHAIIQNRKDEEKNIGWQDRIAQTISAFTGSMRFVLLHLFIFGCWILANLGPFPSLKFDPSFSVLAIAISMEAIFLSTFVLINQNRMAKLAARRADLNLQISLLSEHEITHLIHLVKAMAEKMHLEHANNPVLDELKQEITPGQILEEMDVRQEKANRAENEGTR